MTFLSYAQNFEDVMLWRALQSVKHGYYIDVGAAHPDHDSVTRAFYDRGWRGINIEPVVASANRIRAARPRDVTLQVALGDTTGTADFFVVDGTGLSTLESGSLPAIDRAGFAVETTRVPLTTLAGVCADYAPAEVHFLKIDVEGAEAAVLGGADFIACRPWIVLVEATAPMSTVETHHQWEPMLLAAGYRFVYFDGLNRFYVDGDRYDTLAPSFRAPPNVFDDFVRATDGEWARRVIDAQARSLEVVESALTAERAALLAVRGKDEIARLQTTLIATQAALLAIQTEAVAANQQARAAQHLLDATRSSTSWKLTAPLRTAMAALQLARRRRLPPAPPPAAPPEPVHEEAPRPASAPAVAAPPPAPPVLPQAGAACVTHTVHQFHSGTAVGDAITNAMFLTRSLLRQQGFNSDIFAEHIDPYLAGDIRPVAELPVHDRYVLLVRYSMGFDLFDRIAALPAPKVLMYHNITPPELLAGVPELQHYARMGRERLPQWQPLVRAALADSEYNAIELRRAGFANARASTLLFDLAALRSRAANPSPRFRTDAFTILFVGRVAPSKGQPDLVAAYARFRGLFGAPSRLILVGRHDGAGTATFDGINAMKDAAGVGDEVVLTDLVSDDDLHAWYAAADLYVSLSRHEGFGVPLVEAMAYGIPVLAQPTGAIPYTLDGDDCWLDDPSPDAVAAAMLELARAPDRRRAIADRQRLSLSRFAVERHLPVLLQALAQAGAIPPEDRATIAALDSQMHFTIIGHVNGSYSLAAINRTLARLIEGERPGRVRLLPVEGQPTHELSGVPVSVREVIAELASRPKPATGPELVICQHYPVYVPEDGGDVCVALFFWEESLVPPATIDLLNGSFRGVLAPSRQVAKMLIDSGLSIPVRTIEYVPEIAAWQSLSMPARLSGARFTFLHVSSGFPRKGVDVLLSAYKAAFRSSDNVRLVIKVFPNPHNDVAKQLERLRAADPGLGEIVLIDEDLEDNALRALYADADALVLPSRGEGYNIPAAEAMAAGLPLIVTGFGGHMDFCNDGNARLLDYAFAPSESHLATPHSLWAEPDRDDLVDALRDAVAHPEVGAARADAARRDIATPQRETRFVTRLTQAGRSLLLTPSSPAPRILWISPWNVRCGVAEYSRHLLSAIPSGADVTVFCDTRTDADDTTAPGTSGMSVIRAWQLSDLIDVAELATAVVAHEPDILVIQHQPGLMAWTALARLLRSCATHGIKAVVTLHNTRHLLDVAQEERDAVLSALGSTARVLIHTLADINFLKSNGVVNNVTFFPHGATPAPAATEPRMVSPADEAIVGCYGFFLPGKGIGSLIEAVALLRASWPGVRLRLVNADYGTADSAQEIAACRALAEAKGVPVEWHTAFLPNDQSCELLVTCDVVALPYEPSQEASSAALRSALGAGAVVAVSPISLFDEAADAVYRLPDGTAAGIADGLARLLGDRELRGRTQVAAARWLAERNWSDIAKRLLGMLTGLARSS